jgi:acyl carrier protein
MSDESIEGKVRETVARIAKIAPGFSASADLFRELGLKSAAALDLLLSLEEEFGISISDDAFGEARTAQKIVALIEGLKGVAA